MEKAMNNYSEWETAVVQQLAESMEISYSDASGVVEAQTFHIQQSWVKGLDATEAARKVLSEIRK
ncbi:hypothetical protein ALQ64_00643 [Pseudomonas cannabina]|uniref:Uncharacterized protein n=2 Tax=Pseudomonas cannabina TaxID=86840 RepID=A0A3M3KBQ1_PSECA|nr:hypothetical protein ALQ64_00643 [Pseudomonas cannabina]